MTLRDLLNDAIKYEEPILAYMIYYASLIGIDLDQSQDILQNITMDPIEIKRLIADDPLQINKIKLYSCKDKDGFHLVLAENKETAGLLIMDLIGRPPNKLLDVSHGMDKLINGEFVRKTKMNTSDFPFYVAYYQPKKITKKDIDTLTKSMEVLKDYVSKT